MRAALELREAVRTHKRSEALHRKNAKRLMGTLAALERECRAHGIDLVVEHTDRGGHSGYGTER